MTLQADTQLWVEGILEKPRLDDVSEWLDSIEKGESFTVPEGPVKSYAEQFGLPVQDIQRAEKTFGRISRRGVADEPTHEELSKAYAKKFDRPREEFASYQRAVDIEKLVDSFKELTNQPTSIEKAKEAAKSLTRAFATGISSLPKGVAQGASALSKLLRSEEADKDLQDYATYQYGKAIDDWAERTFPQDPRVADSFWVSELPAGFGSMAAFLAGGVGAKALKGSTIAATVLMGSAAEGSSQYEAALRAGAPEDDAQLAAALGNLVGVSEAVPIFRIFRRFNRASGGEFGRTMNRVVREGLTGSAENAIQEMFQGGAGNLIAQKIYDNERKLVDGVWRSGEVGGLVGFTASAIASALGIRVGRTKTRLSTDKGAAKFVEEDPVATAEIASQEKPSRKQVQQHVNDPKEFNAEDRAALAQRLRDAGAETPEAAQVQVSRAEVEPQIRESVETMSARELAQAAREINAARPEGEKKIKLGVKKSKLAKAIVGDRVAKAVEAGKVGRAAEGAPAAKQPHEMTLEEFRKNPIGVEVFDRQAVFRKPLGRRLSTREESFNLRIDVAHRKAVNEALREGKTVPKDVAKDYPDLFTSKAKEARAELKDAFDDAVDFFKGRISADVFLDPEAIKHVAKVAAKLVKAGTTTFNEFVHELANRIGSDITRRLGPVIRSEWEKLRKTNKKLDAAGDLDAILAERTGRPELAIPVKEPEVRQLVQDVDETRKQAGVPTVVSDTQMFQQAEQRLAKDFEGEKRRLLNASAEGASFARGDTATAIGIIRREGLAAIRSGRVPDLRNAMSLIHGYRAMRTEVARELRIGRDPLATPAQHRAKQLTEAILTPPFEQAGELADAVAKGDLKKQKEILDWWAREIEKLKKRLGAMGLDLDNLESEMQSDDTAIRALQIVTAAKSSRQDRAFEYWSNAILSGPPTHIVNIISNAAHGTWHFTAQRFMEAAASTVRGNPNQAQWGEIKHIWQGLLPGMSFGARNAIKSWVTETPYFERSLGLYEGQKIDTLGGAIPGKWGKGVRSVGYRPLLFADEFYKGVFYRMEVGARAYRLAKAEGLSGVEMSQFINEQVLDPYSPASQHALELARELTFQTRKSKLLDDFLGIRRRHPLSRFVVPFMTVPFNVFRIGTRMSPAGIIPLGWNTLKAAHTGDWSKVTIPRVVEQAMAWSMFLALLANDPEDPWITGASAQFGRQERDLARRTFPSQSIKIGGTWFSYSRLEPFATAISLTVDGVDALKSGSIGTAIKSPVRSLIGQAKNKTFLQGIGDMMRIVDSGRPVEEAARWASNFGASWIPNLVRIGFRAGDEFYPERRVWGRGSDWVTRLWKRTLEKTELPMFQSTPAVDLWGRQAPRSPSPIPGTDWLWRIMVPSRTRVEDIALGDRIILNWNDQHAEEDEWNPGQPRRTYTGKDGKRKFMSDAQYAEYLTLSGQRADQKIRRATKLRFDKPRKFDLEFVQKALRESHRIVKKQLVRQWRAAGTAE
jgi:hypothetical protein